MSTDYLTSLWPDEDQRLLLNAALRDTSIAMHAFSSWKSRSALRGPIDQATLRILPDVFENLRGTECPDLNDLRQLRKHFWAQAQRQRRTALLAASALLAENIEVMVGKGMALVLGGYVPPGTRPMSDVDLYVRRENALAAIHCLKAHGWRDPCEFREPPHVRIKRTPAMALLRADHEELDLHWHCLSWIRKRASDERVWSASRRLECDSIAIRLPAANDLVLHAIIHGVYRNQIAPFRWIVDVVRVFRATPNEIDWQEQAEIARQFRLFSRWRLGIACLEEVVGDELRIPVIAMQRTTLVEVIENRFAISNADRFRPWRKALFGYLAYAVRVADGDNWYDLPRLTFAQITRKVRFLARRFLSSGRRGSEG
jgi:Uncharacterised nucleotidyltransferase